jgi:hypothetical protein
VPVSSFPDVLNTGRMHAELPKCQRYRVSVGATFVGNLNG